MNSCSAFLRHGCSNHGLWQDLSELRRSPMQRSSGGLLINWVTSSRSICWNGMCPVIFSTSTRSPTRRNCCSQSPASTDVRPWTFLTKATSSRLEPCPRDPATNRPCARLTSRCSEHLVWCGEYRTASSLKVAMESCTSWRQPRALAERTLPIWSRLQPVSTFGRNGRKLKLRAEGRLTECLRCGTTTLDY